MTHLYNIEYDDCYVAFLDILGFENLVRSKRKDSREKIDEYFKIIKDAIKILKQVTAKRDIGVIVISDSVILSVRKSSDRYENIEILRQLLIVIRYIQFNLALSNVWLRGGVSSGEAYFSPAENQIVGPAYIDAYNLENKIAIYPRVVIDSKLIKELGCESANELINEVNDNHAKEDEIRIEDRNIIFQWNNSEHETVGMKKDVALFVDYLALSFTDTKHLKIIVKNISKSMYEDNRVYPKFRWVVEYIMSWCMPKGTIHRAINNKFISEQFYKLRDL